jgi:hypothetical protein
VFLLKVWPAEKYNGNLTEAQINYLQCPARLHFFFVSLGLQMIF